MSFKEIPFSPHGMHAVHAGTAAQPYPMQVGNFVLTGFLLHLLQKSTTQLRRGLWLPEAGINQVFDLQKTKYTCIPRLFYQGKMT